MADVTHLFVDRTPTPIGTLTLVADEVGRLRMVGWEDSGWTVDRSLRRHRAADEFRLEQRRDPGGATTAMAAYFDGDLAAIDGVVVEARGTPFQRTVWATLREIPCGTTISYAELARRIGQPSAVRAVGLANGANPVGIVVPCHRVIGADGSLTGYGGGLHRKRWLLEHEGFRFPTQ